MKKQLFFSLVFILSLYSLTPETSAQVRATIGAKAWYATWSLPIQKLEGTEQSEFSSAFMAGPYFSVRVQMFSASVTYSKTLKTFDATSKNPGFIEYGFSGNRAVSREDINVFLSYNVAPEVAIFGNLKLLKYDVKDAMTFMTGANARYQISLKGTGFGLGAQITVPFSGGSPLYSYINTGAVLNSFKSTETGVTSEDSGSELVYFLDGGLGMRFLPSMFGAAIGLRVESGKDTKTIIGPTMNMFYTF